MSLFNNLSDFDSDAELDPDLYELQLVLNRQSDSDSEPSDHEPLSEAEPLIQSLARPASPAPNFLTSC
jgi:hypothetical protein